MSARLQPTSIPPYLLVATPTVWLQSCIPLYLHVPTPLPRPPEFQYLYTSTSTHLHVQLPELDTSTPPPLHTWSPPPDLWSSIPLCLHVYTIAARLLRQMPPSPHDCSSPSFLHTSFSLHRGRARQPQTERQIIICGWSLESDLEKPGVPQRAYG